ncbi:HEAT repeat domain-containing protein, partial [Methanococcoides sp.]|uniref:HEAT repeat domain-containing protein n=1 Tax=Methanococcoides sp. TaxID=1966350 RepID=UPI00272E5A2F
MSIVSDISVKYSLNCRRIINICLLIILVTGFSIGCIDTDKTPDKELALEDIKSENESIRQETIGNLTKIGDGDSTDILTGILMNKNESDSIRISAADALAEIGEGRSISPLISVLQENNPALVIEVSENLLQFGDPATEMLIYTFLDNGKPEFRANLMYVLCMIADEDIEYFIEKLNSEDATTRRNTAIILAELGDERTLDALIVALEDDDRYVRRHAARGLGNIGNKKAIAPLIQVMSNTSEPREVRSNAAIALGQIGDDDAVEPLIQMLKDEDWSVPSSAAIALGELGNSEAIPALTTALRRDEEFVVKESAMALEKLNGSGVDKLIDLLDDNDKSVQENAAYALG